MEFMAEKACEINARILLISRNLHKKVFRKFAICISRLKEKSMILAFRQLAFSAKNVHFLEMHVLANIQT